MNPVSALTHFFVPQDSNNHKARILHIPVLVLALFMFVVVQSNLPATDYRILGYASQISPKEVISQTNLKRSTLGLHALVENSALNRAAEAKAKDMFKNDYWAHVSPSGTQPWDFFKTAGYKYRYAGENLARDFTNPTSAVEAWMASPTHRDNMLSAKYKEIGIAVVDGQLKGKEATIIVQLFGTEMAGNPQIPVAAASKQETVKSLSTTVVPTEAPQVDQPRLQTKNFSRVLSLGTMGFIFAALVVDASVLWYRGGQRKGGKPFAQIAFIALILGFVLVAKVGQIL